MSHFKNSLIGSIKSKHKLALGSICLMGVSLVLIFGARILVSQLALMAVLSAPELLAYTPAFCIAGYVLMMAGVAGFLYLGLRSRFTVDTQRVKTQSHKLKFSIVALTCLLVVTSMLSTTSIVSANTMATTGYYLATPLPIADWYIGNYSNGNIFAINGSNWANLMTYPTPAPWAADTGNYTQVWVDVLAATTSGTIYAKGVSFPLSLHTSIPNNTQVICNYQGVTYNYINANSTLGSPYTVSVGQGINSNYYLAADSGNRITWSSTNASYVFNSAFDAITIGGKVVAQAERYNLTNGLIINNRGIEFCFTSLWNGVQYSYNNITCGLFLNNATNQNAITVNGDKAYIHDLYIDGNKAGQTSGNGIDIAAGSGVTDTRIVNVHVANAYNIGINWAASTGYADKNVIMYAGGDGIFVSGSDNGFVNNEVEGCTGNGFNITGNNNRLGYNRIYLNIKCGVDVNGNFTTIGNCEILSNYWHGVRINGGSTSYVAIRNVVTGCIIQNNGQNAANTWSGINLRNTGYNILTSNSISNAASVNSLKYCIDEIQSGGTCQYNSIANGIYSAATTAVLTAATSTTLSNIWNGTTYLGIWNGTAQTA